MGNGLRKQGAGGAPRAQHLETTSAVSNGLARAFLEGIDLGIYVGAFEVAGFDSEDTLQRLTQWDLDIIERQSHIPILPSHRDKILEASRTYVVSAPPAAVSFDEAGPTEATSTDVTRNVSPVHSDSPTPAGWLSNSKAASNEQPASQPSSSNSLAGRSFKKLFRRTAAKTDAVLEQQQTQSVPAEFPALQPDSPEPISILDRAEQYSEPAAVTSTDNSQPTVAILAHRGLTRWLSLGRSSAHAQQQPAPLQVEDLPSPVTDDVRPHTPESPLFAALKKHAGQDASIPSARDESTTTGTVMPLEAAVLLEGAPASGPTAVIPVDVPSEAAPEAVAAPADVAQGFTLGSFKLSRQAKRKTISKQRPTVVQLFQTTTDVESAAPVAPAAAGPYDTTELHELQARAHDVQPAAAGTADREAAAASYEQQETSTAAEQPAEVVPTADSAAATPAGTGGLFHSFKRIRLRPRRIDSGKEKPVAPSQQQQVEDVATDLAEDQPVDSAAAAVTAAAAVVAAAAEVVTSAAEEVSEKAAADAAAAVDAAKASIPVGTSEIVPAAAADTSAVQGVEVRPPALVVETSESLVATPPSPGPLMVNRAALARSSQGAKLPVAGEQKRKAPTAWSQLPSEVSKMSYAVTAPLEPKPLPPPKLQAHTPEVPWAGVPSQVDNLPYAAPLMTAPLAAAMESWADLPAEASRLLLPGQPAVSPVQPPQQLHQQQREVPRASEATLQPRFLSEPGYKPQQQQQQQPLSARGMPPVSVGPLSAGASKSPHVAAVTAGLPPSAQQLHEQVVARLTTHGPNHTAAAVSGGWPSVPAGPGVGPNSSKQTVAQLIKELSSPSINASAAGPLSSHLPAVHVSAAAPLSSNIPKQHQRSSAVPPAAARSAAAGALPAPREAQSEASGPMGHIWGSESSAGPVHQGSAAPLSAETSHVVAPSHASSTRERQLSATAAGHGSRPGGSHMLADSVSTATAGHVGGAHGSTLPRQSAASVGASTTASQPTLGREDSRSTVGHSAAAHRGLAATPLGGTLTPGSTAGSVVTDSSSLAARSGSGCRASDVRSIVHKAKERAAARSRPPLPPAQEQLEEEAAAAPPPAAEPSGLPQQPVVSPFSAQEVQQPQQQQQQPRTAQSRCSSLPPVPDEYKVLRAASSAAGPAAVAAEDGERTVRMLQDYRTISELDRQIKARVHQLTSPRRSLDGGAAGSTGASGAADRRMGDDSVSGRTPSMAYARQGSTAAPAAQQQQGRQQSGAVSASASDADRHIEHFGRWQERRQQQQQQQARQSHHSVPHDQAGTRGSASSPAPGLLGIKEALDNSFDAGKPRRASTAAVAPASRMATAAGLVSSSSVPANIRTVSGRYDPNRNPFISPNVSPEPAAMAPSSDDAAAVGHQDDNPFLRESLVLQPHPPAPAAAATVHQQQRWQGLTGWVADDASNNSNSAIGQHPGLNQGVVNDIAAAWMSGTSVAPTTAPSFGSFRSGSYNAAGSDVGSRGPSSNAGSRAAAAAGSKGGKARDATTVKGQYSGTLPGAALAGQSMASAAAAARNVDERIKRIVSAGRARSAKAAGSQQQQQQHTDVLTGPAAADQGGDVQGYHQKAWKAAGEAGSPSRAVMHLAQ